MRLTRDPRECSIGRISHITRTFLTFDQQFGFGFAKMDMDVEDFRRVHPRQKF